VSYCPPPVVGTHHLLSGDDAGDSKTKKREVKCSLGICIVSMVCQ
jgi:hypothetical protein